MKSKQIHLDHNGVSVEAIQTTPEGVDVAGHRYNINLNNGEIVAINFQFGPVKEHGLNGLTNEALLAILIDRTFVLDSRFPCEENKCALDHMQQALKQLENRTLKRQQRGVEGRNIA